MRYIAAGFLVFLTPLLTHASADGAGPHLKVKLISEEKILAFNSVSNVGLKFDLEPGWHVYWENPGDSGIPPSLKWILPSGISALGIQWPTPERISIPPLTDYGYETEVLFIVPLQVSTFKGDSASLAVDIKWLVCKEICIPGKVSLSRTLPVREKATVDSANATLFQATKMTLPQPRPTTLRLLTSVDSESFKFKIEFDEPLKTAQFFPRTPLQMDNPAPQLFKPTDKGGELLIKKAEQLTKDPTLVGGILQIQTEHDVLNFDIENPVEPSAEKKGNFLEMIALAFLGGLILNLMPCVFPVLSMKVFGFLKSQGAERSHLRAHALFYTLGILISFWILVAILLGLKAGGESLGWGFQLQSPAFVGFLSGVLFLFGLSLVGVFDIGASFAGVGNSLARKSGNLGAFFTGVLATVVSTPCTAPFMGAAVGFALSQPPAICFSIFTSLALGLALPYVFLSLSPRLGRLLPRPGAWMETVKQITAFFIFGTVVWLLWVLSIETGASYLITVLICFLALSFAAWIFHRFSQSRIALFIGILLVVLALALSVTEAPVSQAKAAAAVSTRIGHAPVAAGELRWEDFNPEKLSQYRKDGKNVFVDFTAAWCVSCKVNELVVFHSQEVEAKIKAKNVVLVKADWTNHDQSISDTLASFGRSGVPAYAIYEKNKTTGPTLLPEVISPGIVIKALNQLP